MNKEKLTKFISKYSLGGNAESVKWAVQSKVLSTRFITEDQTVIGEVTTNEFDQPDVEIGVYTTSQLVKIMGALSDNVDLKFNSVDKKIYSLTINDVDTTADYMLSDLSVIPQAPALKQLPGFDVKIELSKEFTGKFIKAKNALPDADNFAVESDGTTANIIINHSNMNTNKVSFKATALETTKMSPICFSAKLFKEILEANKDSVGTLEVSSKGLGRVTLTSKDFNTVYYLVKLNIN
jgi:ribosome maturation factor RimP